MMKIGENRDSSGMNVAAFLCPITSGGMRRRGYIRIEHEAGGAAQRIYPNDIRDNRRCDGREGELGTNVERASEAVNRLHREPQKRATCSPMYGRCYSCRR